MIKTDKTLTDILGDLDPTNAEDLSNRRAITIQMPAEAKDRYDKLQEKTNRKFGKKVREVFMALIEAAEARTA